MEAIVRLGSRGQVIIPQNIREMMGIVKGDYLQILITKLEKPHIAAEEYVGVV